LHKCDKEHLINLFAGLSPELSKALLWLAFGSLVVF
jgi:hypothetical protein